LLSCHLWFHHDEFGDCFFLAVGASIPYCMHVLYGLHGTTASMHPLYSTVCTMLAQQFNVFQVASIAVSHSFVLQSPRTLTTWYWHLFLFLTLNHTTPLLFVLLSCFIWRMQLSSFCFAFCSKKQVPFSSLVICFHWVCPLSRIKTIRGHLQEVLSLLGKSNHSVNTCMVCVLVDC
jgi:hypothetical protein